MGMDAARRRERDIMRGWRECFRNPHCVLDFPTATNGLGPRGRHGHGETAAPNDAGTAVRGHESQSEGRQGAMW